jgi:hypothetical protein
MEKCPNGQLASGLPYGITDFSDPWVSANTSLPQWEGASLVLVGTGTSTVNI